MRFKILTLTIHLAFLTGIHLYASIIIDTTKLKINDTAEISKLCKIANDLIYNKPDSAHFYADIALKASQKLNRPGVLAIAYHLEGNIHRFESEFPEALDEYLKSLKYSEQADLKDIECQNLNQIGYIYIDEENFSKAREIVDKSINLAELIGDKRPLAGALYLSGLIYLNNQKYDSALYLYKKALHLRQFLNQKDEIILIYIAISNSFIKEKEFDSSLANLQKALILANELKSSYQQSQVLNGFAFLYSSKGDYDKAIEYEQNVADIANSRHDRELLAGAYQNLGQYYAAKGDFKNAYLYDTLFGTVNDLVYNEKKLKALAEKQTKYETEKKDILIQKQTAESVAKDARDTQRSRLLYISLSASALILILALLLYNRNRVVTRAKKKVETVVSELTVAQQKLQESEKELENKVELRTAELANANTQLLHEIEEKNRAEAEIIEFNKKVAELQMTSLRLQMNPHFIFNSLNSIQHFIYNNNKEEAASYLAKFSRLIRQILEHANENTIAPADDLKMLQLYMELEMLRFDNKFEYELDIDPSIDIHNIEIPSMLIQPFVENAILHGLVPKENGKGKITIRFMKKGNSIDCIIEDNGIGRDRSSEINAHKVMNKKSLGIKVSRERLDMLNIDEENEGSVSITDLKDLKGNPLGTRVEIRIPVDES